MKSNKTVGRPLAKYSIPNKLKFTFKELSELNSHVSPLACRQFIARDAELGNSSRMFLTKETLKTSPKGRESAVYMNRSRHEAGIKAAKTKASKVTVPLSDVTTPETEPVSA